MTVWKEKHGKTYRYEFYVDGQVYRGSTKQVTRDDALEWEEIEKRRIRRALGGLPVLPEHSPRISDWAERYLDYVKQRGKVRRIEVTENLLRVVLRFWGARPADDDTENPPIEGEPYHDYRLADPIRDPELIERFEDWIRRRTWRGRPVGKQTRLHYMSIMSRMYRAAMRPQFKKRTGVTENPFLTVERDKPAGRRVTVTPEQLRAWLGRAPRHTQLAMAIAALAPKLRMTNVLQLRWDRHVDPDLQFITVHDHKTVGETREPLVAAISPALQVILRAAREEATTAYVVSYRKRALKSIRSGVRSAATEAGLVYGRFKDGGVTFHTIRHTAATLLAEVSSLTEAQRAATMGQDILTTQKYTHLRPHSQRPVAQRLARRLRLGEILDAAFRPAEEVGGPPPRRSRKPEKKQGKPKTVRRR